MELLAGADVQSREAKRQGVRRWLETVTYGEGQCKRATARSKMFGSHWGQTCTTNTTSFTLKPESKARM